MNGTGPAAKRTSAIGIVLPVHNEETGVASALAALGVAMAHPALAEVPCRLAVVFDACTDATADIVRTWSRGQTGSAPLLVTTQSASVGAARRIGCATLLRQWTDRNPHHLWLATTDADSEVPPDWLAVQMRRHDEGYDLWAGRVTVIDWSSRPIGTAREWSLRYDVETAPIHGASLGCNAGRYLEVGGYRAVRTGEDRALHRAVTDAGGTACYDHAAPVTTSARRRARAPLGFSHHLGTLESSEEISA